MTHSIETKPDHHTKLLEGQYEFQQRWQDALRYCEAELGPEDYALISRFGSPGEMIIAMDKLRQTRSDGTIARLLRTFRPRIFQITTFSMWVALGLGLDRIGVAGLWGLIMLMLELASRSDAMLEHITAMWTEVGLTLQIFDAYREFIDRDIILQDAQFDVLVELMFFAVHTVKSMKNFQFSSMNIFHRNATLELLKTEFREISEKMANRISIIKRKVEADMLRKQVEITAGEMDHFHFPAADRDADEKKPSSRHDPATLPCYYVPFPLKNANFYGRGQILDNITRKIGVNESTTAALDRAGLVTSLAIWATAGIGKTQIALAFADQQRAKGVQAIFWIRSEDETESAKSFTEIAAILGLPGAVGSVGHDQNRLIVLQWLQKTKVPWLMIFDNLESCKLLNKMLPSCGHGSVLVTCRSELLAASAASSAYEIPAFSIDDGKELLLRALNLSKPSGEDLSLASEIVERLGGHALAIDVMARYMLGRKKSLREFNRAYQEHPRSWQRKTKKGIPNLYYEHDLGAAWLIAFEQLEEDAARLLGIVSMLAPDRIPLSLFARVTDTQPAWNADPDDMEDLILDLKDKALIKAHEERGEISIHRLIQEEFRATLETFNWHLRWIEAAKMLHLAFPQQLKGFTFFNEWPICEGLIEHVEMVCQRYRDARGASEIPYTEDFVYLASDSSRYLIEIGRYNAALQVTETGFSHCKDDKRLEFSNLCVMADHANNERGRHRTAVAYARHVLDIRRALLAPDHPEIANALSNLALSQIGAGDDLDAALASLQHALRIDLLAPEQDGKRVLHLRHYNLAFAYRALGRIEECKTELRTATEYAIAEFGPESRYLTITHRAYADFEAAQGRYDQAFHHLEKSLELALKQNATNQWVSASLYKMGVVRLQQGRADDAVALLRRAEFLTRLNVTEKGDEGDTARVLNQLSHALLAQGKTAESEKVGTEASALYNEVMETGEYTQSDDPTMKWEYLVSLKFR